MSIDETLASAAPALVLSSAGPQSVIDIAPGGLPPLKPSNGTGKQPPKPGEYWLNGERIHRETRPSHRQPIPGCSRPNLPA